MLESSDTDILNRIQELESALRERDEKLAALGFALRFASPACRPAFGR